MNTLGLDQLTDGATFKALPSILASENIPLLREVGRRLGAQVNLEHSAGFRGVATTL